MIVMELDDFCIRHVFGDLRRYLHQKDSAQREIRRNKSIGACLFGNASEFLSLLRRETGRSDDDIDPIFKDILCIFINDLRTGEINDHIRLALGKCFFQRLVNGHPIVSDTDHFSQIFASCTDIDAAAKLQTIFCKD